MVVGEKERETKLMIALAVPFALAEKSQEEPGEDIALHTRCVVGQFKVQVPLAPCSDGAGPQAWT